ncbi:Acetyltransferase involved in cellulose biosynthesis, CelD/BcsL family [Roseomonas rosea]|uniref:Acetyltransferase involved in cellulose biosynthesis, CelD/BcsL family n=1 Tax=Muricoccus roseus TaxID=198092 RepID=A0A1M6NA63_9PROT|nr:GNAT family N-acetyltransferase [Roseomonas rosea]SHJ92608.1 Acetyltransferase involved in cellulose biosynthesis, CelD/BcsL family [Roseomonas rosea]
MPHAASARIDAVPVTDFQRLGQDWRALEAEAAPTFFRSWTWVGTLAEERFPDPVLLRATRGGRVIGLALFNRRRRRLFLGESGDPALDAPFVEHNGPLVAAGVAIPPAEWLAAAWRVRGAGRLVLSGVERELADRAGVALRRQVRLAPYVDLEALRGGGGDYLATLSANARQQIRRSMRAYAAAGPLRIQRAETEAEALDWFEALMALHQADWQARGRPGAFAHPFMQRFHRALIPVAQARGELDLLRVIAGERVVGFLYNLRAGGVVHAYQSGLDRAGAMAHGKPGLTCHSLAILRALAAGDAVYDLMAGSQRYKTSLARQEARLVWVTALPADSLTGRALSIWRCISPGKTVPE